MLKDLISRINPWQSQGSEPAYRIALDIGTEYVKAVYLEQAGGVASILGVGRAQQDYADMDSGAVANIAGVEPAVGRKDFFRQIRIAKIP